MVIQPPQRWIDGEGPDSDVVMSCRVRLARNVAGFPFANRASETQRQEILTIAKQSLLQDDVAPNMIWVDLNQATALDRRLLFERHLISKHMVDAETKRGVAISGDETLSVMVNEEDHLRIQALAPGFQLRKVLERINAIDDRVESRMDFAFSPKLGYLTACPTNLGTGIRYSCMMHLPALKLTEELTRVQNAARDLHLAVRGYYGEGTESAGDFYQVSNQITLGRSEEDFLEEFEAQVVPKLIDYERFARQQLIKTNSVMLDDRLNRAVGILKNAHLIGVEEAMKLLSRVRLGIQIGRLEGITIQTINRLFL
ncbi:MAG TPA: protein arginine kinase, partial [Phycisphaerales bacterium]|nr:protein arginine kinase [Phycisphaerales bacterium]